MGGLVLMAVLIITFSIYNINIKNGLDEAEKSTMVKQYIENAKNSQEQILLKGEPTIFSNFIVDDLTKEEQKLLNKAFYILKDSSINNNIVLNLNDLCSKIQANDVQSCKNILEKRYNFLTLDSNGVNMNIGTEYTESLNHLNTLQQAGYNIEGSNAKLSNNSLKQFDSNLKQIETMAAGNTTYVQSNSVKFSLAQANASAINLTKNEASATKSEVMNIISTSLTNTNSLTNNIDVSNLTNEKNRIIQESLKEKDSNKNIKALVQNQNINVNLTDETINTNNLDVATTFKSNNNTRKESFSVFQ